MNNKFNFTDSSVENLGDKFVKPFKVALVEFEGDPVPSWVTEPLEKHGIDLTINPCTSAEELSQHAADADVVWVFGNPVITADRLDSLSRCGAILRTGSGYDNVPVEEATKRGIIVANTPGAVFDEVADHTIGLLLSIIRQIVPHDKDLKDGKWLRRGKIHRWHLRGTVLGLIGFGRIARSVAQKMSGFDIQIKVYDPYFKPDTTSEVEWVELDALLSQSDFVSVHCPLNKDTHHLLGEEQLKLMKPNSIFINTCRGPVVDEGALIKALQEGWISAAGLDVFEEEPLDSKSPLLKMENVVLTPHIAGGRDVNIVSSQDWVEGVKEICSSIIKMTKSIEK